MTPTSIPLIRVGGSHEPDDTDRDRCIVGALKTQAGFVATDMPEAADLDARMRRLMLFFALPESVKLSAATRKYRPDNPNIYRGFYPLPSEPHWSHNEIFDIGPEPPMTSPTAAGRVAFTETNVWPEREPYQGWRTEMLATLEMFRALGVRMMIALARGLGIDEDRMLEPAIGRNATLRLLHYAPAPPDFEFKSGDEVEIETLEDGRRLIARAHVDTGLLSMLWQDVAGLQMQGAHRVWRDVPLQANALSVHCGDLLEGLSGGRLSGTKHRVAGAGGHRYAMGFFLEPDFETLVLAPGGERPVSYAQHLVNEFPDRFEPPNAA